MLDPRPFPGWTLAALEDYRPAWANTVARLRAAGNHEDAADIAIVLARADQEIERRREAGEG